MSSTKLNEIEVDVVIRMVGRHQGLFDTPSGFFLFSFGWRSEPWLGFEPSMCRIILILICHSDESV